MDGRPAPCVSTFNNRYCQRSSAAPSTSSAGAWTEVALACISWQNPNNSDVLSVQNERLPGCPFPGGEVGQRTGAVAADAQGRRESRHSRESRSLRRHPTCESKVVRKVAYGHLGSR